MSLAIYMVVMAGVTYLIRMLPFTLMRKKIKSRFFRSFLYYVPYAVLSAMTFPSIFYSTGNVITAAVGTFTALVLAYYKKPLIVVALCAAASALTVALIIKFV
ncbi:MAG: AzlD domain-containing protein [Clostridia bacterium]|nr:AzlD domain-containing protein [Clostridia bacterium]